MLDRQDAEIRMLGEVLDLETLNQELNDMVNEDGGAAL